MTPAEHEDALLRLRRRLWIERLLFAAVLGAVVLGQYWPRLFPQAWAVYVDGEPVVAMTRRADLEAALESVRRDRAGAGAGEVQFAQEIRVRPADGRRVSPASPEVAREKLARRLRLRARRAVIYVDDLPVVALPEEADASAVLQRVRERYAHLTEGMEGTTTRFKERVQVVVEPAGDDLWADPDTAAALLLGEDEGSRRVHTVVRGETALGIAARYGISVSVLRSLNPGINLNRLRVGHTLYLAPAAEPVLTVVTEGRVTRMLPVPFATEARKSPRMYVGKRIVARPGMPGAQRVTYLIRAENGVVVDRRELQRTVLHRPQDMVVIVGALPRP